MRSSGYWFGVFVVLFGAAACDDDNNGGGGSTATSSGGGGAGTGGSVGGAGAGGNQGGNVGTGGDGGSSIDTTPCDSSTCDLTVTGTGFGELDGKTVYVGLQRQGQAGLEFQDSAVIAAGGFTVSGQGVLQKNLPYFLNYFVDLNENQACEITPDDAVWRLDIGAAQGHLDVALSYHEGFANLGCSGFP